MGQRWSEAKDEKKFSDHWPSNGETILDSVERMMCL